MRCDDSCPKCKEPDESVTHTIFKCPPALQVWASLATPTSSNNFHVSSIYANMIWKKNIILEPYSDRDGATNSTTP